MSDSPAVRVDCPAKLNLFLEVHGLREDGYHEIRTVLQAIDLVDTLKVQPSPAGISLSVSGAPRLPTGAGNLVHDAATRFFEAFAPGGGVSIRLTKRIPDQAGLGGGSSDAAGTLLALARLFPGPTVAELVEIGAGLGSDVPYFLDSATALARGRGEDLRPLPTPPPTWVVLFLPPFGLSTSAVYGEVEVPAERDRQSPERLIASLGSPSVWKGLFNRLEEAARRVDDRVPGFRSEVESRLGAEESLHMTGSGSAFFAVAPSVRRAAELASVWNRAGPGRALAVRTRTRSPGISSVDSPASE